jgi:hypothetical protein
MLLSSITELPPGRQPVQTRVLVDGAEARAALYSELQAEVERGGWPGRGVGGAGGWAWRRGEERGVGLAGWLAGWMGGWLAAGMVSL